jgi:DNA-directed RNA polymerase sigma subunit (sigma70/sigma32)
MAKRNGFMRQGFSNPEKSLLRKERREILRRGLHSLTDEERIFIKLKSGFNRNERSHTFEEIGSQTKKTFDQIIQVLRNALEKLRKFFERLDYVDLFEDIRDSVRLF